MAEHGPQHPTRSNQVDASLLRAFFTGGLLEKLEFRYQTKRLLLKDTAIPSLGVTQTVNEVRTGVLFVVMLQYCR